MATVASVASATRSQPCSRPATARSAPHATVAASASQARNGSAGASSDIHRSPPIGQQRHEHGPAREQQRGARARGGLGARRRGARGILASGERGHVPLPATAAITAPLPERPARKPWQPATVSTGRRPAIPPGTTMRQPPGVRPSPRGGRSTTRAAT